MKRLKKNNVMNWIRNGGVQLHIGRRIRKIRKVKDIPALEIYQGICSSTYLTELEEGQAVPDQKLLRSFACRLQVPESYLVDYDRIDAHLEEKLDLLKNCLYQEQTDEAGQLLKEIHDYRELIPNLEQELFYFLLKTHYYTRVREVSNAIHVYEHEIKPLLTTTSMTYPEPIREIYFYIKGLIHYFQRDYIDSYEAYLKQLRYLQDDIQKAKMYYNAALSFYHLNDLDSADTYCDKAVRIYLSKDEWYKAAETYTLFSNIWLERGKFEKTKTYCQKALHLAILHDYDEIKALSCYNLGVVYREYNEYDSSISLFNQTLSAIPGDKYTPNFYLETYLEMLQTYVLKRDIYKIEHTLEQANNYCSNDEDFFRLNIFVAKKALLKNKPEEYESRMKESLHYLYGQKAWEMMKNYAEELSTYYSKRDEFQLAYEYLQMELRVKNRMIEDDEDTA
jgi:HTH-type transcriptional regulator, quorum sensing regulator NprR